jgi:hypothetical protein
LFYTSLLCSVLKDAKIGSLSLSAELRGLVNSCDKDCVESVKVGMLRKR